MTIGDRIRAARTDAGISQVELGQACGASKQTIWKYENNVITNIPMDKLSAIARHLGVSASSLMGWSSEPNIPDNIFPMPNFIKKPRLSTIACGDPILALQDAEEFDDVPEGVHCDFTLKCKGDSMINARIFDGDIVYIRQQEEVANGEIAAVLIDDEATLKRVHLFDDHIVLSPENPMYKPLTYWGEEMNTIRILGKAVAFTSTVR